MCMLFTYAQTNKMKSITRRAIMYNYDIEQVIKKKNTFTFQLLCNYSFENQTKR